MMIITEHAITDPSRLHAAVCRAARTFGMPDFHTARAILTAPGEPGEGVSRMYSPRSIGDEAHTDLHHAFFEAEAYAHLAPDAGDGHTVLLERITYGEKPALLLYAAGGCLTVTYAHGTVTRPAPVTVPAAA